MKPFGKILEEITIESSVGYKETIDKLVAQRGPCQTPKKFGVQVHFDCTSKGEIRFLDPAGEYGGAMYDVEGRVEEQDGKTIVKIYSIQRFSRKFRRYSSIIAGIAMIAIEVFCVIMYKESVLQKEGLWLVFALAPITTILTFRSYNRVEKNRDYRINFLKNEIIKRVENIKRWDD